VPVLRRLARKKLGGTMTRRFWLAAGFRFCAAALLLSLLVFGFPRGLMTPALPFMTHVLDTIQRDYHSELALSDDGMIINMTATTRKTIPGIAAYGSDLTAGAHTFHALLPAVWLFSVLCVWPVDRSGERILLLLAGLPLSWLILAITLPFQLAGMIEAMFQEYAAQYGVTRPKPWLWNWLIFFELGGDWVVPFLLAFATGMVVTGAPGKPRSAANNPKRSLTKHR
jgi:hypothetical protein